LITLLDTDAAVFALEPEWTALWSLVPGATPFAHPAWLLPWWRQFGNGQARVAVARASGVLTGVLPMYALDGRCLPIGAGMTDYHDALLVPGQPVMPLVAALPGPVELMEVPPGAALRTLPAAWSATAPCPALALTGTVMTLLPPRTARKLRMNRNRAARAGGFTMERATPETAPPLLEHLIRLHTARWTGQGEAGVLADAAVLAFHRASAPGLVAAGLLRLQVLRVQGIVAAACYALLAEGRILFYLSGFDAGFAEISPGTLLLAAMLEEAQAEGRWEADFLRGNEAYKYAWGGVDRYNLCARLPVK